MTEVNWDAGVQRGRDRAEQAIADLVTPRGTADPGSAGDDPYAGKTGQDLQAALNVRHGAGDAYITPGEMGRFLGERRASGTAQSVMRTVEVVRPGTGHADTFDRELQERQRWLQIVGRWFTAGELLGQPRADCAGCSRLAGVPCDEHVRRMGERIPLPPEETWPSRLPGHVPGAIVIRPGYDLLNSVK